MPMPVARMSDKSRTRSVSAGCRDLTAERGFGWESKGCRNLKVKKSGKGGEEKSVRSGG